MRHAGSSSNASEAFCRESWTQTSHRSANWCKQAAVDTSPPSPLIIQSTAFVFRMKPKSAESPRTLHAHHWERSRTDVIAKLTVVLELLIIPPETGQWSSWEWSQRWSCVVFSSCSRSTDVCGPTILKERRRSGQTGFNTECPRQRISASRSA